MLATINPLTSIKNEIEYRASKPLHQVVTPQAVALCYVWLKVWVPFELKKESEKISQGRQDGGNTSETVRQGNQDVPQNGGDMRETVGQGNQDASQDGESQQSNGNGEGDGTRRKRGRIRGNPTYLKDENKKLYSWAYNQVKRNLNEGDQKVKWDNWWKQKMKKVVKDHRAANGPKEKKRKRSIENKGPLLPSGAELLSQIVEL
jgi:hypothetical protein